MRHRDEQLRCDERGRNRRVNVSIDQDQQGLEVDQGALETDHKRGGLPGLTTRADAQVDVRLR